MKSLSLSMATSHRVDVSNREGSVKPTADDVAIAIVAACRETGDDPIDTANGGLGINRSTNRARHYALHALIHVFPKANRTDLCRLVGCPGKPGVFWNASWHQVVKPRSPGSLLHMASWFDDTAYDRVIRAIEADMTRRAVAPPPKPQPEPPPYRPPPGTVAKVLADEPPRAGKLGRLEPNGYRPPAGALDAILDDDRPVMDASGFAERRHRSWEETKQASKSGLEEELRRAVENTAKMTPRE